MQYFQSIRFFKPYQSGVLMTGKAAAFIQSPAGICRRKNKKTRNGKPDR
jgi:hypothetical protein